MRTRADSFLMCSLVIGLASVAGTRAVGEQSDAEARREAMLARAAAAELDTVYVAPPGDPLSHHISGFAKTLCSAVFVTGLDPDFAAENVGFFSGPYEHRARVTKREIDRDYRQVHLTLPDGVVRTAKVNGDHGCVTLPVGEDDVHFDPVDIATTLPDPATEPWPMGDVLLDAPLPAGLDGRTIARAVDAAHPAAWHVPILHRDHDLADDAQAKRQVYFCVRHDRALGRDRSVEAPAQA